MNIAHVFCAVVDADGKYLGILSQAQLMLYDFRNNSYKVTYVRRNLSRKNKQTPTEWMKDPSNRPVVVVSALLVLMFGLWMIVMRMPSDSFEASKPTPPIEQKSSGNDELTKLEIKKLEFVKDVYISPGHINIGVIRSEKRWDSPMIGTGICGILRRTGSTITRVRFVDIEEVVYQQKPAQAAEIYLFNCP